MNDLKSNEWGKEVQIPYTKSLFKALLRGFKYVYTLKCKFYIFSIDYKAKYMKLKTKIQFKLKN